MTAGFLCRCAGRHGYTQVAGTEEYVCGGCHLPAPGYEEKRCPLVMFRAGPLDGGAYMVNDLVALAATQPVGQYHWTPEKITSPRTGAVARVWHWSGPPAEVAEARQENTPQGEENTEMAQNTTSDGVTNTQLLERRTALGLSRATLATAAGVTQSQLGSMEKSGKRIKEGVMDRVDAALKKFEAERESAGDKESHTPPVE